MTDFLFFLMLSVCIKGEQYFTDLEVSTLADIYLSIYLFKSKCAFGH